MKDKIIDMAEHSCNGDYGLVYVLTNPTMPGLVKIGMTNRSSLDERMKELYGTGVPVPFTCEFACKVKNADTKKLETALHISFEPFRINTNVSFLKSNPSRRLLYYVCSIEVM